MRKLLLPCLLLFSFGFSQILTIRPSLPIIKVFKNHDEHSSGKAEEGDYSTEDYSYNVSDVDYLEVKFDYSLGSLNIKAGEKNMIIGTIKYNSEDFTPVVNYENYGSKGVFTAKLKSGHARDEDEFSHSRSRSSSRSHSSESADEEDDGIRFSFDFSDLNNEYSQEFDFKLPPEILINLELDFGVGETDIDLTDLTISNLEMDCGLSDTKIKIDKPNKTKCKEIYIESGLGDLNAYGLGNLRAKYINLDIGLGSAYIDLSTQKNDLVGDIEVGLGSLDLVLPEKANITLRVEDSFLSSIDVDEMVKTGHKEWSTTDFNERYPNIELDISIGLGSVDVDLVK
ncbi:MAG: hypothetical protein HQ528_11565 [Candidatus Marinimicrobia bacterium]|nr:hypothetical protein [Candidatus Neomarinimicrobiota bacterium]